MSWDIENGYAPRTYEQILQAVVDAVNKVFSKDYTIDTIRGTNWEKFYYVAIQLVMQNEAGISELSNKLIDYIRYENSKLQLPHSTVNGFLAVLEAETGLQGSFKQWTHDTAGIINFAVDVDKKRADYADIKRKICRLLFENLTAGLFFEGTEKEENLGLNGQLYETAYELAQEVKLNVKINIKLNRNVSDYVPSELAVSELFRQAFAEKYRFGNDFNPDIYMCYINELPFAGAVDVQHSTSSAYESGIFQVNYNQKIVLNEVTTVIEE